MAFFLTPRYAPAQFAQCNRLAFAPVHQPQVHRYVVRPRVNPLAPFIGFFDDALIELDREARRELHRQRRQHKQLIRAHFVVNENETGYQIDGELPMFEQENISLEVTDAHTIKVSGNTQQKAKQSVQQPHQAIQAPESQPEAMDVTKHAVTAAETTNEERPQSPTPSETGSNRSYQATVEDDFEDLGAEMASIASTTEPKNFKGKEKAVESSIDESSAQLQTEAAKTEQVTQVQQPQEEPEQEEQTTYTFERTFRFTERIDGENVSASFKNGLLSIVVPKAKDPGLRRIQIQ